MKKTKHINKIIVLLCTLAYFVGYISRKSFAVVFVNMVPEIFATKDEAGMVSTALFIFYGVGQLISGYLGDKISAKWLMSCGLFASAICNLILPLMPSKYLMIPVWAINGFAQALLWPPIVKILAENLSHKKYVTANLIVTCGAHVSTILLYVYAPICIHFMSYKAVFYSASIITAIVGVIFLISMSIVLKKPEKPDTCEQILPKNESCAKNQSLVQIFKSTGLISIFICIIAMGIMRDGIENWLPTFYCEEFGKSDEEGILVSVLLPIFSIISLFVVRLIHKTKFFNNEARGAGVLFVISIALCVPVLILNNFKNPVTNVFSLVLIALICALMHSCNFLLISCVPGRFAHFGRASTIGGICNACTYIGASISSYGFGLISERLGWNVTIIFWIVSLAIGVIFAIIALKRYSTFLKSKKQI